MFDHGNAVQDAEKQEETGVEERKSVRVTAINYFFI